MAATMSRGFSDRDASKVSVSLQIMSDLHLETPTSRPMYPDFIIEPKSPYLALLGDIGNVSDERLIGFLRKQLEQFEIVFYVFGNHEPYHSQNHSIMSHYAQDHELVPWTFEDALSAMQEFEDEISHTRETEMKIQGAGKTGQFVLMNRRRFDVSDDVAILGCTLFSRVSDSQRFTTQLFISDFSSIASWTVDTHNAAHKQDLNWLNSQVQSISKNEPHRRIVILTHHSPTNDPRANDPEHLEDTRDVQSAFVTDLSRELCWRSDMVKLWAFGHTHHNCNFTITELDRQIVANQRGYGRGQAIGFEVDSVICL